MPRDDGTHREPTFEELVAQRQHEWTEKQARLAADLAQLHATLSEMPDVVHRPHPDHPFKPGSPCACACGGETFFVSRWVTINGSRHRMEARCATCQRLGVYDFGMGAWVSV